MVTFSAEAVLHQELAKVRQSRELQADQPGLLAWLQHLKVAQLVDSCLVDEVELFLLPLGTLWLHIEPDREGQGRDILEGSVPPEEILMDGDLRAVIHKLDLDLWRGGRVQDGSTVPE